MFVLFYNYNDLNYAWYIQDGFSPLGAAIARGHTVVVELLIECGTNVSIKDKVIACCMRTADIAQVLILYVYPMHCFCRAGDIKIDWFICPLTAHKYLPDL
jgi:hypothetical protein